MIALLTALLVLSVLVLVHELGHFLAAKKAGIKVEEFGLGYPPRLWGKRIGSTLYSLNAIPFGGFVRIYGLEEGERDAGSFWRRSKKVRGAVLISGILMNFVLAVFAFALIYFSLGVPQKQGFVEITGVVEGSPAAQAEIQTGDLVAGFETNKAFIEFIKNNLGQEIGLSLERQGEAVSVLVVPRQEPPEGEGPLGVVISDVELVKPPFWQRPFLALWFGVQETIGWTATIFLGVGRMIYNLGAKGEVPQDIAGPVGIVQVTSNVVRVGVFALLQFLGMLSVNLAVLNFLPIPALDGGRLLFLGMEMITGHKPKPQVEKYVHMMGMIFLIVLMVAVTIQDIRRLFMPGVF